MSSNNSVSNISASVVSIPNVAAEERIGSAFDHLFRVIHETENSKEHEVDWDFSKVSFLHPFFLFPLALYRLKSTKEIVYSNTSASVQRYFTTIEFDTFRNETDPNALDGYLSGFKTRSYLPCCQFPIANTDMDAVQTVLQSTIELQSSADKRIKTPLSYMLAELVDNIKEHSESSHAYIFAQYLPQENAIHLCIADSGITIYSSYIKANRHLEQIQDNEAQALWLANKGYSTKDRPETENRGYGISSSQRMLVKGLGGSFFMFSGKAFYGYEGDEEKLANLPDGLEWNGTIILMKIPCCVPADFNYNDYIE